MKKMAKQILSFVIAMLMILTSSYPIMAKENNTTDKNGNSVSDMQQSYIFTSSSQSCIKIGNEIYYAINLGSQEGIYKINKKATKTTSVWKKSGACTHLSHYGKWIYFIWDKEGGGNGCSIISNSWLCKVKLNGTGFKKICRASSCMIRNNTLYYQKTKSGYDETLKVLTDTGTGKIGKMNLKTGKKSTFKGNNMCLVAVEKNKIYYSKYNNNDKNTTLYSMSEDGKNRKKIKKATAALMLGTTIYNNHLYWFDHNKLYTQSLTQKKIKKVCSINGQIKDIKNGKIYVEVLTSENSKLYSVSLTTGKKTCILKLSGNNRYAIYGNYIIFCKHLDIWDGTPNKLLYSYNLKTKKKVLLAQWYEQ